MLHRIARVLVVIAATWFAVAGGAEARFLQTDPVGYKDNLNLYVYVQNDPLNAMDPFGTQTRYENMLMQRDMPAVNADAARSGVNLALDLAPGVGDVKGAIETAQDPSALGVAAVVVGLVPGAGDALAAGLRNSDLVVRGGLNRPENF